MYDFSKIRNFKESEFVCKCCGKIKIDMDLVRLLDTARDYARIPFVITSGYRCVRRNKAVGGVADSAHLKGLAQILRQKIRRQDWLLQEGPAWPDLSGS